MGEELKALTEQLHEYNEQLLAIARRARERNQEPDFLPKLNHLRRKCRQPPNDGKRPLPVGFARRSRNMFRATN